MRIFSDVCVVIVDDKLMITHLPVDCKGDHNQKQADKNIAAQDGGLVFDTIHMLLGACDLVSVLSTVIGHQGPDISQVRGRDLAACKIE